MFPINLVPVGEAAIAIGTLWQASMESQPIEALSVLVTQQWKADREGEGNLATRAISWPVTYWRRRALRRAAKPAHQRRFTAPTSAEIAKHLSEVYDQRLAGKEVSNPQHAETSKRILRQRSIYFPTREAINDSSAKMNAWMMLFFGTSFVVLGEFIKAVTADHQSADEIGWAGLGASLVMIGLMVNTVWNSRRIARLCEAYTYGMTAEKLNMKNLLGLPVAAGIASKGLAQDTTIEEPKSSDKGLQTT